MNVKVKTKKKLFSLVLLCVCFLFACENEEAKPIHIEKESFIVESIDFKKEDSRLLNALTALRLSKSDIDDKVIINTDSESLVLYKLYTTFYKIEEEESRVCIKKKVKDENSLEFKDDITGEVYLNKTDVKKISEEYALLYTETLNFERLPDERDISCISFQKRINERETTENK